MMFDLNGNDFQESTIFNGGNAGLVKDVDISLEKKVDDSNSPDFKLIAKNATGSINVGFYYITPNPQKTEEQNSKLEKMYISRVVHLAKAVMGKDYIFPNNLTTSKQVYDTLFDLVAKNCTGKKFNIFTSYGTKDKPSKYLGFRFFSFIEPAETNPTTLILKNTDLMERPTEDSSEKQVTDELSGLGTKNFVL